LKFGRIAHVETISIEDDRREDALKRALAELRPPRRCEVKVLQEVDRFPGSLEPGN
jgi:hypothetical protein